MDNNINKPVSTFMVLPALGWTAFVSAKALADGDDMYLVSAAPAAPVRSASALAHARVGGRRRNSHRVALHLDGARAAR